LVRLYKFRVSSVFNPWLKNFQFAFLPAYSIFA
jgi:hypothetical protein